MIAIQNLKFSYPGQSFLTLNIPELKIKKNEKVFIYGPSGSGKSTFLEILAGVLCPEEGQVQVNEIELTKLSTKEKDQFRASHMGYIFQSFNLIPYLNVKENIELPLYLSSEKKKHSEDLNILCEKLGLTDFLQRGVTELSIGQQQRVAAARALYGRPELILADEPTSSLDYDHREKFIATLFDICNRQGSTLLFVSHDRSLEKLFDRSLSFVEINKVVR